MLYTFAKGIKKIPQGGEECKTVTCCGVSSQVEDGVDCGVCISQ